MTALEARLWATSANDMMILGQSAGKLDPQKPGDDDFELWSPSEERVESCLFGRQVSTAMGLLEREKEK